MSYVQSPHQAIQTASLATSKLIANAARETAEDLRAESGDVADALIGMAEGIEEKMAGWAEDLAANYGRACTIERLAAAPSSTPGYEGGTHG